jgi:hypothetical protein
MKSVLVYIDPHLPLLPHEKSSALAKEYAGMNATYCGSCSRNGRLYIMYRIAEPQLNTNARINGIVQLAMTAISTGDKPSCNGRLNITQECTGQNDVYGAA